MKQIMFDNKKLTGTVHWQWEYVIKQLTCCNQHTGISIHLLITWCFDVFIFLSGSITFKVDNIYFVLYSKGKSWKSFLSHGKKKQMSIDWQLTGESPDPKHAHNAQSNIWLWHHNILYLRSRTDALFWHMASRRIGKRSECVCDWSPEPVFHLRKLILKDVVNAPENIW